VASVKEHGGTVPVLLEYKADPNIQDELIDDNLCTHKQEYSTQAKSESEKRNVKKEK
jgi:hypothetical protein